MKVLCLGGSGGMGRDAAKAIANFPEITSITNEGLDISRSWEL